MFSTADVQKIAKLSLLEVAEEDKATFAKQFSQFLEYCRVLEQVQIPEIVNSDRDEEHLQRNRPDLMQPSGIAIDSFSPYIEQKCFKVPKVIDPSS